MKRELNNEDYHMMKHSESNMAKRVAKNGESNIHVNVTEENLKSKDEDIRRHEGQ